MSILDDDDIYPKPRKNSDLRGQEDAERVLLEAFNSGRLHHAWLITGPKGIGKATLAHRFARFVMAHGTKPDAGPGLFGEEPEPETLYTDPESPLFKRIAAGGHADLLSIQRRINEKTGKLKTVIDVDSVREVGGFLSMTPAEGGFRVVVIDSADEMNVNSANAVLKVLEEPPKNALLLLVSHNPGRLLPTIRSRCRKLTLRPLPTDLVAELAQSYLPNLGAEEAMSLAALADGSIGRALTLADEGGLELWAELGGVLHSLPRLDVTRVHKLADKVARAGADEAFHTVTGLLRWWLERLILAKSGKQGAHPAFSAAETEMMNRIAAGAGLDRWFQVWEKSTHLVARSDAIHLDRKQVVLDIFLSIESALVPAR